MREEALEVRARGEVWVVGDGGKGGHTGRGSGSFLKRKDLIARYCTCVL